MTPPSTRAQAFAHILEKLMGERQISRRRMGRLTDPADPERGRTRLKRHLSGKHYPSDTSIAAYARALNVPVSALEVGDDPKKKALNLEDELRDALRSLRRIEREVKTARVRDRMSA